MPTMSFMPQLKEFLLEKGVIYTVRKYKMVEAVVDIDGVGRCNRIPVLENISKSDLAAYVESSGFHTLEDWWTKVRYFTPDKSLPLYLYKIETKKEVK